MSEVTACGCAAKQTKHLIKVISPDDYDEAVLQDPSACPHFITGDYRCGSQLLADSATDIHIQLAAMAATISGRIELDAVAAFVESASAALDRKLGMEAQAEPMVPAFQLAEAAPDSL